MIVLLSASAMALLTGVSLRPALFVTHSLNDWFKPESLNYKGLVVKRTFEGAWDELDREVDVARARFGERAGLGTRVANSNDHLSARLDDSVGKLLDVATLPESLSEQIRCDARSIGCVLGAMCPSAHELELKLEIFGENTCARWHKDQFVGRAIVSYTGAVGTEYSRDSNVDFWALKNGGTNDRILRNVNEVESVDVGDILFIKGTQFPHGVGGLVHKSPEKRYHEDGRVLNRLVLKVDVMTANGPVF